MRTPILRSINLASLPLLLPALLVAAPGCGGASAVDTMTPDLGPVAAAPDLATAPDLALPTSACRPPITVQDPWVILFMPVDGTRGNAPLPDTTVEVHRRSDDGLLASGMTDAEGKVTLSIPTGGKLLDAYYIAKHDKFRPSAWEIQGGLGNFPNWMIQMYPPVAEEAAAGQLGVERDPTKGSVMVAVFKCNTGNEGSAIAGATVEMQPGSGAIFYDSPMSGWSPDYTNTQRGAGHAIDFNVPDGPVQITLRTAAGGGSVYTAHARAGVHTRVVMYP